MVKVTLKKQKQKQKKHTVNRSFGTWLKDMSDIDSLMLDVDKHKEWEDFTSMLEGFISDSDASDEAIDEFGSAMLGGEEVFMDAAPFDSVYDNIICGDVHRPPQCVICGPMCTEYMVSRIDDGRNVCQNCSNADRTPRSPGDVWVKNNNLFEEYSTFMGWENFKFKK